MQGIPTGRMTSALIACAAATAAFSGALLEHSAQQAIRTRSLAAFAAPTPVLDIIDRALSGAAGPDDESPYPLIDPIGPGGVRSTDAIDEVLASTMQGGKYGVWRPYRDPLEPPPDNGTNGPYQPGGRPGGP